MRRTIVRGIATALIVAMFSASASAGLKDGDVNIGIDPDTGQLTLVYNGDQPALPPINGPLFGFGVDDPGFISLENSVVGLQPPAPGANIVLQVISFDPALKAWTPGFASLLRNPGDLWDLGAVPVHEHPFWQIDSHDPNYIAPPAQTEWNATFRLLDTGTTGYPASDPLTITFTPEPSGLSFLLMGAFFSIRRFRRS